MIQRILNLLLLSAAFALPTTSFHAQVTVANERSINTAFQEYSPAFYQQGLVFIAANPAINKDKKEDTQLGKSTTSIFFAKRNNDGTLQRPVAFADELTTKFYDGPLSFNPTGDVVFFTRTNLKKGKPKTGKDGKVKLKIYSAKLNAANGKWENIEELPFNDNDFDCMHPSVSADGTRLYFVSNRPGGKGGMDIYVSFLQNGKWGDAVNLGPTINTPKDELTPFIHPDNTLFFATNGRKGMGGTDIFWTKKTPEGWAEPAAMPEPINTPSDDFGIIVSADKKSGFFSSNRASGLGEDDIFSFIDNNPESRYVIVMPLSDETKNMATAGQSQEDALTIKDTPIAATQPQAVVVKDEAKKTAQPQVIAVKDEPKKMAQPPVVPVKEKPKKAEKQPVVVVNEEPKLQVAPLSKEPKLAEKMQDMVGKEAKPVPQIAVVKEEKKKPMAPPTVVKVLKEEPKTATNEVDFSTQQEPVMHSEAVVAVSKIENNRSLMVDISAVDKLTNYPLSNVAVSVFNMKSIKNASFMTDSEGRVTGLRSESGKNIPLDILPSQEGVTDEKGNVSMAMNTGDRFIFNFATTGYEPKYVVKTVIQGDSKVVAFMTNPSEKIMASADKDFGLAQDNAPKPQVSRTITKEKTKARTTEFTDYTSSNSEFKESVPADNATGRTAVKEAEQTEKPVVRIAFNEAAVTDNYTFEIKARYQNQDDADVDENSKLELNPLLKMMENDVKIEIEVASHTAATGKIPYNLTISQLRADNIKTYFIENGIDPNRMRSFGYGETMVRNRCKRGVNCSATEHAENLRTLIKIVKGMEAERITDKGAPVEMATEQSSKTNKKPLKAQNTEGGKNRSLMSSSDVGQRYYVIIGTFTRAENAQKHRKKAVDLGFVETEVVKYPDSAMYGVAVRIMSDAKEAKKLSDYINKQKEFEAFVKEVK